MAGSLRISLHGFFAFRRSCKGSTNCYCVERRTPNQALEPTPNSLRSCLAPAIGRGSPPAFGFLGTVMSKDLTLYRVPFVHLYRDLSFADFFGLYDPWRDGKVRAATYSFSHKDFGFWAKLLPNSVIYVDQKYEA